jgi:molybdenum cofactor biosynthesis protein B
MEGTRPRALVVTVSDSHQGVLDRAGPSLREALVQGGVDVVGQRTVGNDAPAIVALLREAQRDGAVEAIVFSGGTGLGPKDVTVDAVEPLFERRLEGFGEAFRRLSWDEIGARAVLSRATAGLVGALLVFVVPGSARAAALGGRLVAQIAPHAVHVLRGGGHG